MTSWKEIKDYLFSLINQVDIAYGGDGDTNEYAEDVLRLYKHDIKEPIQCFESLLKQAKDCRKWIKQNLNVSQRSTEVASPPQMPK